MSTRVAVVGAGSLGAPLAQLLGADAVRGCIGVGTFGRGDLGSVDWSKIDVLVEAAGSEAAVQWLPPALAAGKDVLLCSCGVLADDTFLDRCAGATGRILVPAGAVGGLDIITAARRSGDVSVRLTTTKRATALRADSAGEIFRGTAREAAIEFPRTSNVAVTVGLAVGDLDAVDVVVRADPSATSSRHVLEIDSTVGTYRVELANAVLPESGGRTSVITLWSVVCALEKVGPAAMIVDPAALARSRSV
jgi:aspartate dehydrogenase